MITHRRLAAIEAQGRPVDKFELTGSIRELLIRLETIVMEVDRHYSDNLTDEAPGLTFGYLRIKAMALGLTVPGDPRPMTPGPLASPLKNNMSTAKDQLIFLFTALQNQAHANSCAKGFWLPHAELLTAPPGSVHRANMMIAWKLSRIALMHSELSEAVEGIRKDLPDDHLPHRSMEVCELADTVIRILDYAGAYNLPLMEVILEKMAYNETREFMHGKKA